MAATDFILSATDLHALFEYKDGDLFWKVSAGHGRIKPGTRAGVLHSNGYKSVRIQNVMIKQHRVIFVMFHGRIPFYVDHVDGNPSNNRIENLREATAAENTRNSFKQSRNSSGAKGVYWHKVKQKWIASCCVDNSLKHIGYFEEKQKAVEAVRAFREEHHGEFANHG
jgi:hypothetical protein